MEKQSLNSEERIAREMRMWGIFTALCGLALIVGVAVRSSADRVVRAQAAPCSEGPCAEPIGPPGRGVLSLVAVHYSPAEDLEKIDLAALDTAKKSVDISTYAMDDKPIADELVKLAGRGVAIRIYRDKTQYEGEVARGAKGRADLNSLFKGVRNIHVKVKGVIALAHLKSYLVDGELLREGSANWSPEGEKVQDNSLLLVRDAADVAIFERNFEAIWNRPSNETVQ
jgi:phosphatidylserine/phosphatidylglycerophosphate/cardiolipin synthase-like enzyme